MTVSDSLPVRPAPVLQAAPISVVWLSPWRPRGVISRASLEAEGASPVPNHGQRLSPRKCSATHAGCARWPSTNTHAKRNCSPGMRPEKRRAGRHACIFSLALIVAAAMPAGRAQPGPRPVARLQRWTPQVVSTWAMSHRHHSWALARSGICGAGGDQGSVRQHLRRRRKSGKKSQAPAAADATAPIRRSEQNALRLETIGRVLSAARHRRAAAFVGAARAWISGSGWKHPLPSRPRLGAM